MKKTTIKIISIALALILLFGIFSTCFAAYTPLTTDNLTSAFEDIDTVTSSALKFNVEGSKVTVTAGSDEYSFDYNLTNRTFSKEVTISDGLNENELNSLKPELLSTLYGYIAASIVQGKSVSESTNYIVSEIKNMDNYVREKLVSEGNSNQAAQDDSSMYNPSELLNSSIINNILDGLSSHASGDVSYSDSHTFSIKIEKTLQNKVILTLTILDNDFMTSSTASKSMSYNLTTIVKGEGENSSKESSSNSSDVTKDTPSESDKKSNDNTISKASKIPQTGRSYTANNVVIFAIIITFLIIIGMIAYDVRKNKKN